MKVYIAGSSYELDRVRAAMDLVRSIGAEVAFDWTEDVEQLGSNPIDIPTLDRQGFALKDLDAIECSDLVWLLAPETHSSRGACVEFGYALALSIPVLITGSERARRQTIFFDLATFQRDLEVEAVSVMVGIRDGIAEFLAQWEAE